MKKIILASQSPRRIELMKLLNVEFDVVVSHVDESIDNNKDIYSAVEELAYRKAHSVLKKHPDCIVIGVDTIVYADGNILNKPKDKEDAFAMIKSYANTSHEVISGVSIVSSDKELLFHSTCQVHFDDISDDEIHQYLLDEQYSDKAGAYGIQGSMAKFISKVDGDYYSVVGFPVHKIYKVLKEEFI